jgi:hypothetical protein
MTAYLSFRPFQTQFSISLIFWCQQHVYQDLHTPYLRWADPAQSSCNEAASSQHSHSGRPHLFHLQLQKLQFNPTFSHQFVQHWLDGDTLNFCYSNHNDSSFCTDSEPPFSTGPSTISSSILDATVLGLESSCLNISKDFFRNNPQSIQHRGLLHDLSGLTSAYSC